MAKVVFEELINFITAATPSTGYLIGYDIDGILKQKDRFGVITPIGASAVTIPPSNPLDVVLLNGNNSGSSDIIMGTSTSISSANGSGKLELDYSTDVISLSTDNSNIKLDIGSVSILNSTGSTFSNLILSENTSIKLGTNNYYSSLEQSNEDFNISFNNEILPGIKKVSPIQTGENWIGGNDNKAYLHLNTYNSVTNNNVRNSVIIGGNGLTASSNDTVYVQNLEVQKGLSKYKSDPSLNVGYDNLTMITKGNLDSATSSIYTYIDSVTASIYTYIDSVTASIYTYIDNNSGTSSGTFSNLTADNGLTIISDVIELGGTLNKDTFIIGSGSESVIFGGTAIPTNNNDNLNVFGVNTTLFRLNSQTDFSGGSNDVGTQILVTPGEFSSTNNINPVIGSQIINGSSNSKLGVTSNKIFRLSLDNSGSGIAPGSGESFTINGSTFSEGVDFVGQGNYLLDAATIAGLTYSGVANFVSVTDELNGFVRFEFSNPAIISETLSDGLFLSKNWDSSIETSNSGVTIKVGDDDFYGTPGTILTIGDKETIFTDNSLVTKGIQYASDYSSGYTSLSLITKGDLDLATASIYTYIDNNSGTSSGTFSNLTADNGITITSDVIELGGTLNKDTFIKGTGLGGHDLYLGNNVLNENLDFLYVYSTQQTEKYGSSYPFSTGVEITKNPNLFRIDSNFTPGSESYFYISSSDISMGYNNTASNISTTLQHSNDSLLSTVTDIVSNDNTRLEITHDNVYLSTNTSGTTDFKFELDRLNQQALFTDSRVTTKGIEYADDYSSGYTLNSLITKRDLDNATIGTTVTSGNGITIGTSSTVDLGGTMSGNVDINGAGYDWNIKGLTGYGISTENFYNVDVLVPGSTNSGIFEDRHYLGVGWRVEAQNSGTRQARLSWDNFSGWGIDAGPTGESKLTINHAVNSRLSQNTNTYLDLSGSNSITLRNPTSQLTFSGYDVTLDSDHVGATYGGQLRLQPTGNTFTDHNLSGRGLQYAADYSATFVDRSLVDKAYVDNFISGTAIDYIDFNTTYTPTLQEGRIHWDSDYGTLDVDLEGGEISLKVGLDNLYYIKNQTGSLLEKGKVIRAAGTLGTSGRILGDYMIADNTIPHYFTLGIAGEDILNGEDGYVYEFGLIRNLDTTGTPYGETWSNGDILYVSPTQSGGLTKVRPTEPDLKIQMAIVIDADANGSIFVRPSLGYNLSDLHNVQTAGATGGDLLSYDSVSGYWDYTKNLTGDYTISGTLSATAFYGDGSNLTNLLHTNASNEITNLTEKTSVDNQDELIIEDSDASFVKKSIKRINLVRPIDNTQSSVATLTPNSDENEQETITSLSTNLTINAPSGSPTNGQKLIIRIKDNGTARTLGWNAIYRAIGVTLPTTTTISKTLYLGFIYNITDTKWDCVAVNEEA